MRLLKKFENYMSREEMCNMLCNCGYNMNELEVCSDRELEEMCRMAMNDNMTMNTHNENMDMMSREEMCNYLCDVCGYDMNELDVCSNDELKNMCGMHMDNDSHMKMEKKSEKWIQKAIKKPGALRKSMKKDEDEKISKKEIADELAKLAKKDKDPKKKGVQGLSKGDLKKYRQLNLAKTLKGLKEHRETQNYMFFSNLDTIKRLVDEMLEMDEHTLDNMLSEHDWASDHISVAAENIEHVFNFVVNHGDPASTEHEVPGGNWHEDHSDMMEPTMKPETDEIHDEEEVYAQREGVKSWRNFTK